MQGHQLTPPRAASPQPAATHRHHLTPAGLQAVREAIALERRRLAQLRAARSARQAMQQLLIDVRVGSAQPQLVIR